eukprot:scaffold32589_cov85-Phaeocystis_antarctica.AAC.2
MLARPLRCEEVKRAAQLRQRAALLLEARLARVRVRVSGQGQGQGQWSGSGLRLVDSCWRQRPSSKRAWLGSG